jgi:hypothetical protein
MRTWVLAGIALLLAGTVSAQDGLRSATLPERSPSPPLPTSNDLYRVSPDFYQRPQPPVRPHRNGPIWWGGGPFWPTAPAEVLAPPSVAPARPPARESSARHEPPRAPDVETPRLAPGLPKTFYVIPGCYAGDKRPDPEKLRPGCQASDVRVIPPS